MSPEADNGVANAGTPSVEAEKTHDVSSDDDLQEEQPDIAPATTLPDRPSAESQQGLSRSSSRAYTVDRFEAEAQVEAVRTLSIAIAPTKTADGTILVNWYTSDDAANPHNWGAGKKAWVLTQLA